MQKKSINTNTSNWKLSGKDGPKNVGHYLSGLIARIAKEQIPDLASFFPYQKSFNFEYYFKENMAIFRLISVIEYIIPHVNELTDVDIINNAKDLLSTSEFPNFLNVAAKSPKLNRFDCFVYIGTQKDFQLNYQHLHQYLIDYLNHKVLPEILEQNKKRVLRAIPLPPVYDIQKILTNIYLIETPSVSNQGTCFLLKGVGFITCSHCIEKDSVIYKASNLENRFPVNILKKHDSIDLAIFTVEGINDDSGLEAGDSDIVSINDHIAVAGFPNHNYGDSGIFSPGLIVGFRMISGIKRFLVNTPLIAGNSGGPILSYGNQVIGVAVTGADKMQNAGYTEDHGVVPISAIKHL